MTQNELERKSLLVGAVVYGIMGIAGWGAFYLSNSGALLLDGNYNLVSGIAALAGYIVVRIKERRTLTFPFGQFIYESLYSLIKGVLVLGILIAALWENVTKIIQWFREGTVHEINPGPIAVYTVSMMILSLGLAAYYRSKNKSIGYQSSMLKTDTQTATIDGLLTLVAGGGVLLVLLIGKNVEGLEFLQYTGDSMIVILFALIAFREPLGIIKSNFIELAGGRIQSEQDSDKITGVVNKLKPGEMELGDIFINKTGSSYLVVIYVKYPTVGSVDLLNFRSAISEELGHSYSNIQVEILIN